MFGGSTPTPAVAQRAGLKSLDERVLNKLLDSVPADAARDFLKKKLPEPSNRRAKITLGTHREAPKFLQTIITELGLLDEPDAVRRYDLCLGYFRCRRYAANTVCRYLKTMRQYGLFGDGESIKHLKFDSALFYSEKHTRLVDRAAYGKFVTYMLQHFSKFNAPLLLSFYTGLRTSEILQFTVYHLQQLTIQSPVVDVRRKNTSRNKQDVLWKPVYNAHLIGFVGKLKRLYADEFEAFTVAKTDVRLFLITPKTLVNRMNVSFLNATGRKLPEGFGVHGNRTTVASIMYDTAPNLIAVQNYLQHRNASSTRRYVRADVKELASQFDRITAEHFDKTLESLTRKN